MIEEKNEINELTKFENEEGLRFKEQNVDELFKKFVEKDEIKLEDILNCGEEIL